MEKIIRIIINCSQHCCCFKTPNVIIIRFLSNFCNYINVVLGLFFVCSALEIFLVSVKQYAARLAAGIQPIWKALSLPKPKPKRPQPKPRKPKKKEQSTHLTHFYEIQHCRSTSQPPSETPTTTLIRNPYAQHPSQQWVPAPAQAPRASLTSRIRQGIRSGISFVQQQLNFPDHPG